MTNIDVNKINRTFLIHVSIFSLLLVLICLSVFVNWYVHNNLHVDEYHNAELIQPTT